MIPSTKNIWSPILWSGHFRTKKNLYPVVGTLEKSAKNGEILKITTIHTEKNKIYLFCKDSVAKITTENDIFPILFVIFFVLQTQSAMLASKMTQLHAYWHIWNEPDDRTRWKWVKMYKNTNKMCYVYINDDIWQFVIQTQTLND